MPKYLQDTIQYQTNH